MWNNEPDVGLGSYHERVPVGGQQARTVAWAQGSHGAVVRVCGSDEIVHVAVAAAHARGRSHRMAA